MSRSSPDLVDRDSGAGGLPGEQPLDPPWAARSSIRSPLTAAAMPMLAFLALPIAAIFAAGVGEPLWSELTRDSTRSAVWLSLWTTSLATSLAVVVGTPLAVLLARRRLRGRRLLEALVELPMVLPPAVAGVALLLAFGRRSALGGWLDGLGLGISFTPVAAVLAQLFVAGPFFVKTASVGFASVDPELEAAAAVDGATPSQTFWRVTLPLSRRAIGAGALLCWARALGEFGATIIFAGNYPGRTQTMPLAIYLGLEVSLGQAVALSVVLLAVSLGVLLLARVLFERSRTGSFDPHPR